MKKTNELSSFLFHQGTNYRSYDFMGAHKIDTNCYVFRVWAPNADSVFVVGDFNSWDESCPMSRVTENGIWELTISAPALSDFANYKYKIKNGDKELYKSDPYAFFFETPPATASKIYDLEGYRWNDAVWLENRAKKVKKPYDFPMNIYELHILSFKLHDDGTPLSYLELANELPPYLKQMGYTHVEMLPVMEHPFDGSWGYQVCGYYAPTSRLGTPKDFMALIDSLHCAGIGVILDWVPAHFPKDAHGLYEFDGQRLYEYQGDDKAEYKSWGTRRFDVGRNEVEAFLVSNADFWINKYHADGLRVDAVASMLYLDYDKQPGEWLPNSEGENKSLEAVAFFRKLNGHILGEYPDVLMIAEESTAWENVTSLDGKNGLGFSMKWNMGWMNDTLSYAESDPYFRKYIHEKITFSMMYAFNENFVLPISHDEVVHGKKSFLDKMPGDYDSKFAGARAFLTYIMTHPGKKLTFMGGEIGQFREWDYKSSIEWFLLDFEKHARLQLFVAELNALYQRSTELFELDNSWDGFSWIDADNSDEGVLSYRRIDESGNELIVILNLTPVTRQKFNLGVPYLCEYEELISTDDLRYGGSGITNKGQIAAFICKGYKENNFRQAIEITLAPLGGHILKPKRNPKEKKTRKLYNTI